MRSLRLWMGWVVRITIKSEGQKGSIKVGISSLRHSVKY